MRTDLVRFRPGLARWCHESLWFPFVCIPILKIRNIRSFRRQCYLVLKNNAQSLNASATLVVENRNYQMYIPTETMTCFTCGAFGHSKGACPESVSDGASRQSDKNIAPSGASRWTELNVDFSSNYGTSKTGDWPSCLSAVINTSPAVDVGFITVSSKKSHRRGSCSEGMQASCSKKIASSSECNVSVLETVALTAGLVTQNRFSVLAEE